MTLQTLSAKDYIAALIAERDRLRAALSWIEDHDPQLVDAAREKFCLLPGDNGEAADR